MSAPDHQCKDDSTPSPLPWTIVRTNTPFGSWIMDATGGCVAGLFGSADERMLCDARLAHDAAATYRDTLNTVRRRLLDLATGRNPAQMAKEAEQIANLIHMRLQTPERGAG